MVSLQRLLIGFVALGALALLSGCGPQGNEGNEGADMTGASKTPAPPPPGRPAGVGSGPQSSRGTGPAAGNEPNSGRK